MISEGCSNDAEYAALITGKNDILQYMQIENVNVIIFHNIAVFTVFLIK